LPQSGVATKRGNMEGVHHHVWVDVILFIILLCLPKGRITKLCYNNSKKKDKERGLVVGGT
jgi:hypothetical protein